MKPMIECVGIVSIFMAIIVAIIIKSIFPFLLGLLAYTISMNLEAK